MKPHQKNMTQKSNSHPTAFGILASVVVAIPIIPATLFIVLYGALGGTATMGGLGAASQPNTEWWAPLATIGAPLLALAIIIGVGVFTTKYLSRKV